MTVRTNSVAAWRTLDRKTRAGTVLQIYRDSWTPLTDREVAERLGFTDMNCVRPRITELLHHADLIERESVHDPITGKKVRTCQNARLA